MKTMCAGVVLVILLGGCAGFAGEPVSPRETRREARAKERKADEQARGSSAAGALDRDAQRLDEPGVGKVAKSEGDKVRPDRLDDGLARRVRESEKLVGEKLGRMRDLEALAEAEESRARAEKEAREKEGAERQKRKIDLTVFWDW